MSAIDRVMDLSIRGAKLEPRTSGGGVAAISWESVAGALAGVEPEASDLVRAVYLGDTSCQRRVRARLQGLLMGEEGLDIGEVPRLAGLALAVHAAAPLCRVCEGRGWVTQGDLVEQCVRCDGEGQEAASEAFLADQMGVEVSEWRSRLLGPFWRAVEACKSLEVIAVRALAADGRADSGS